MKLNVWKPAWLDSETPGGKALVHSPEGFLVGSEGVLFDRAWLSTLDLPRAELQGIGTYDGIDIFVYELDSAVVISDTEWSPLRPLMMNAVDGHAYRMLVYAAQIATWMRHHRFCGHCGTATLGINGERARGCPACGLRQYPRISPSMIVLVTRGDDVLLARSPRFLPGVYSTLAGFVEPGETIEECVHREVSEEVGVQVRNLKYLASQSWPFPHSLMLGFHAEYEGGDIVLQPEEIEDAQWFSLRDLPQLPGPMSISRYLIDTYRAGRMGEEKPSLPR
ncbi:NAD(+) diphosphatase [Pseudomonas matsuisoli]|uniref:NAD-capped RNA hydrolase NudC n=1 Tax=Pseudomonas matsuisoli TaxID=1515666 RepID=A0A917PRC2_9PSED|nr:NAD(+) diphosphatase [Pseudomonas matsuisoli]GGJ88179.1 NADH pyrophosphatase [Pseudomonas matsuisoli]